MKMAGNMQGWWRQRREEFALQQRESSARSSFFIPSPVEGRDTQEAFDERGARARHCTEGKLQYPNVYQVATVLKGLLSMAIWQS